MPQILVIEKDELIRTLLRDVLEQTGYEIIEASDSRSGMEAFRQNPTDLVIVDELIPEGLDSINEIRSSCPGTKIISISGGGKVGKTENSSYARLRDVVHTLARPFNPHELLEKVRELLTVRIASGSHATE